jgi:hypothetical protein
MTKAKRWIKPYRQKQITNQSLLIFQLNFSRFTGELSQSHAMEKAQMQGWPSLTLALVDHDNQLE